MARVKVPLTRDWRPEPIDGSKSRDELWVGVKCQTNSEIAGSPRNAFRGSRRGKRRGGRALNGLGGAELTNPNQTTNTTTYVPGVRPWGLSSIVERETAQIAS